MAPRFKILYFGKQKYSSLDRAGPAVSKTVLAHTGHTAHFPQMGSFRGGLHISLKSGPGRRKGRGPEKA